MCMVLISVFSYFFSFNIIIRCISNFFDLKTIGLKVKTQAPNEANFYELQWIALKLKNMHKIPEKVIQYQSQIANQAESMRKYDFMLLFNIFFFTTWRKPPDP